MKIVVGGATSVGKSIIGYLSLGDNDIVVVDEDAAKLDEIAKEFDVQPFLGSISHPDVQEAIGIKNTDMLIAVTDSDEINMVACQVAYTLFNVPKKIARVDSKYFLNPLWNTLYNEKSLPIDLVITPDIEIARFISDVLDFPGSSAIYPFMNRQMNILAFRHFDTDIPFMKFSVAHINHKLAELNARIVLILRGNRQFIHFDDELYLQRNDVLYISCTSSQNMDVMRQFGVDHNPFEKIVMFGANAISQYLASNIENTDNGANCKIIEDNPTRAQKLASVLNRSAVMVGEMMSDVILDEAGFNNADVSIAVTDRDKDNLLISLLAAKNRDTQAISLINSRDYNVLAANIRNNVIVDRSVITISAILKYLRKARIEEAYALGRGLGEIWEIRLGNDSSLLGKTVNELNIPSESAAMLIMNNDRLIYNIANHRLAADDKIIMYVSPLDIRQIEKIFYL